jgi:hypothetical protein
LLRKGEIANLETRNYYVRLAAIHSQDPCSGETVFVTEAPGTEKIRDAVIAASRKNYCATPELITELEKSNIVTKPTAAKPAATSEKKRPRRD